jgi:hypothetical protein
MRQADFQKVCGRKMVEEKRREDEEFGSKSVFIGRLLGQNRRGKHHSQALE